MAQDGDHHGPPTAAGRPVVTPELQAALDDLVANQWKSPFSDLKCPNCGGYEPKWVDGRTLEDKKNHFHRGHQAKCSIGRLVETWSHMTVQPQLSVLP